MDPAQLRPLLERATELAWAAGQAILQIAQQPLETTAKEDGSPLTRADLASNQLILAGLEGLRTPWPILSEEAEPTGGDDWRTYWCVDPLDGTKEFVKGLGEYTVNIALVEAGTPILGAIHAPAVGLSYAAARGLGAFRTEGQDEAQPIAAVTVALPRSAVVSRSHRTPETERFLAALDLTDVVSRGSSLKLCAVAEGAADLYPRFGPTCLWDTAAGTAIALQAGCEVLDLDGRRLSYDVADGIKRPGFIVCPSSVLPHLRQAWWS